MRIGHCLVVVASCAHGIRLHRSADRYAKLGNNSTASAWAALQGFFREGRWRDLFDHSVEPDRIGEGSFGVAMSVTLAPICRAAERVVVKQILLQPGVDSEMLNNELQIQQAIGGHPNIVGLYDYHPQDPHNWKREGSVFVMMPLAAGGHVDRAYANEVKKAGIRTGRIVTYLQWAQAKMVDDAQHEADHKPRNMFVSKIAVDMFAGLAHMHSKGYVHRDLKPQNIWASHDDCMTKYSAECKYMLGDFGMSAPVAEAHKDVCGTPPYFPPEIPSGGHPLHYTFAYNTMRTGWSKKGDVYALGLTLLNILTGEENVGLALGSKLFDMPNYLPNHILGLGKELTALLVGILAPEPGFRINAVRAHELAVEAFMRASSGRRPPAFPTRSPPMCVQECSRMSCCYNLRCNILEGKCDDGSDPRRPARANSTFGFADAVMGVVNAVGQGMGWVESKPEGEPIGPVPPKILPTGKYCYEKDEIPAGERLMRGLLSPQEKLAGVSRVPVASGGEAPQIPPAPRLELVSPGQLGVTWAIPQMVPPITSITVGVRVVGDKTFVVDATDGRNVLVPSGGQPIRAPTTRVQVNVHPGYTYEALVSFRNSVGPSQPSPASAPVVVPAPKPQERLPPPPPPPLHTAPTPTLTLVGSHSLRIDWVIHETSPPVLKINVGLRVIGGQAFMVNTSDSQIRLVSQGAQAVAAPLTHVVVNVQPGFSYDAVIAMGGSGTVTPWSEPSAQVAVPNVAPSAHCCLYDVGDPVSYHSVTHGQWIDCYVTKVDARGIQVNQKLGEFIPFDMLEAKVRPRDSSAKFAKGDLVSYLSGTMNVWMDAQVVLVDGNGVQVNLKPGEYIEFDVLEQKIQKRASTPQYRSGDLVSYFSDTTGQWIDAKILGINDQAGIVVDVKPGEFIPFNMLGHKIKPRQAPPQAAQQLRGYNVDDLVSYLSGSTGQWLDAKVTAIDATLGIALDLVDGFIPFAHVGDKIRPRQAPANARPLESRISSRTPVQAPESRIPSRTPVQALEPPRVSRMPVQARGYAIGQPVWYYSTSGAAIGQPWLSAIIINADQRGVYVDVKPGVPIPPEQFEHKLKPRLLVS